MANVIDPEQAAEEIGAREDIGELMYEHSNGLMDDYTLIVAILEAANEWVIDNRPDWRAVLSKGKE